MGKLQYVEDEFIADDPRCPFCLAEPGGQHEELCPNTPEPRVHAWARFAWRSVAEAARLAGECLRLSWWAVANPVAEAYHTFLWGMTARRRREDIKMALHLLQEAETAYQEASHLAEHGAQAHLDLQGVTVESLRDDAMGCLASGLDLLEQAIDYPPLPIRPLRKRE